MGAYGRVTFRAMRRSMLLVLAITVVGLAACGGSNSNSGAKLVQRRGTSTSASSSTTTTTTAPSQFKVGDTVQTALGNKETVYAYVQPVQPSNSYVHPDAGKEFAAADIETCATGDLTQVSGQPVAPENQYIEDNPYDYELVMPDNTRLQPSIGAKDPGLNDTKLYHGDCVRGWVSWQVPAGTRPSFVVDAKAIPPIKWKV